MEYIKQTNLVRHTAIGIIFLIGFQLMSCMPVMMMVYGIHQPRYVSDASVIKYYHALGLQNEIYRLKDYTESKRNQFQYVGNSMPDMLLFNSNGQLITFDIDCSNNLDSIARLSRKDIDSMKVVEKTLREFIGDTYVINGSGDKVVTLDQRPLYVVKFAEFAGRLNKENVPKLVERLNGREDVQFIVLNMDYSRDK